MDEIVKIAIDEYEKKPDGSWISVATADVITKNGMAVRLSPGMVFKKGVTFLGLDIAETLDKVSAG